MSLVSSPTDDDTVEQFVRDLRELWTTDGRTLEALARSTTIGRSTLGHAVKRFDLLPSERTVREFVGAIAPDQRDQFLARRASLDRSVPDLGRAVRPVDTEPPSPPEAQGGRTSRRVAISSLTVGLVVTFGIGFGLGHVAGAQSMQIPGDSRAERIGDGEDPINAGCVSDAASVAETTSPGKGTLQLIYSTACDAFWARIERTDQRSVGHKVEVDVFESGGSNREQVAVEPDVTGAYTFMLERRSPSDRYCARGAIWVDDRRFSFDPVC